MFPSRGVSFEKRFLEFFGEFPSSFELFFWTTYEVAIREEEFRSSRSVRSAWTGFSNAKNTLKHMGWRPAFRDE